MTMGSCMQPISLILPKCLIRFLSDDSKKTHQKIIIEEQLNESKEQTCKTQKY